MRIPLDVITDSGDLITQSERSDVVRRSPFGRIASIIFATTLFGCAHIHASEFGGSRQDTAKNQEEISVNQDGDDSLCQTSNSELQVWERYFVERNVLERVEPIYPKIALLSRIQ